MELERERRAHDLVLVVARHARPLHPTAPVVERSLEEALRSLLEPHLERLAPRDDEMAVVLEQERPLVLDVRQRDVRGQSHGRRETRELDVVRRTPATDVFEAVLVGGPAAHARARLSVERPHDPDEHRRLEEAVVELEARREVDELERAAFPGEHSAQDVRVLEVRLLDLARVDPSTVRRPLFAVEKRAEDEARIGTGQQPFDQALLQEGVVQAVSDDGETLAHGSYSRARSSIPQNRRSPRDLRSARSLKATARSRARSTRRFGTPLRHHGLVIASNRLPIRLTIDGSSVQCSTAPAACPLRSAPSRRRDVGWLAGNRGASPLENARVTARPGSLYPVFLSRGREDFYGKVCNDTLWPLFHYFQGRLRITPEAWTRYVEVNERFADTIVAHSEPDSRVWVHDFHLMLVPAMLRRRAPGLSIGFFLHIPFPSSEVYRVLPAREQLLRGVLGADYVSFQVGDYARHFRSSCLRMLGIDSNPDWLELDGRRVGIGVDPIGIDVDGFREVIADPETERLLADLEHQYEGRRLVLGVERLDYTKGIPQKLQAFERFLEQDPTRARTTTMIQVVVPSRLDSPDYRAQRDEIELLIARINGQFGRPGVTPVEYIHRDISKPALVALYRRADVMMVTGCATA